MGEFLYEEFIGDEACEGSDEGSEATDIYAEEKFFKVRGEVRKEDSGGDIT